MRLSRGFVCRASRPPCCVARRRVARRSGGAAPIAIAVDASDAPRRIFHVQETIPAAAGTLTLVYPKWIPGEHSAAGR